MLISLITASSNATIYSSSLVLHHTGFPVINCKFLSSASSRQSSSSFSKCPSSVSCASIRFFLNYRTMDIWVQFTKIKHSKIAYQWKQIRRHQDIINNTDRFTCTFPNTGVWSSTPIDNSNINRFAEIQQSKTVVVCSHVLWYYSRIFVPTRDIIKNLIRHVKVIKSICDNAVHSTSPSVKIPKKTDIVVLKK